MNLKNPFKASGRCDKEENKRQGFSGFAKEDPLLSIRVATLFFFSLFALLSPEGSAQTHKYVDKD